MRPGGGSTCQPQGGRARYEGAVRYEGSLYRPPSEADALILQATLGCSWNRCTYCAMYRDKDYSVRPLEQSLEDLAGAAAEVGPRVRKLFVADGDALILSMDHWRAILGAARTHFPNLRRVSCYAQACNVLEKTDAELAELAALGLTRLYIGPESGDPATLKRIGKNTTFEAFVEASARARGAGMEQSVIFLLGAGGIERSAEHAAASAALATAMDPDFLAALTLTVVPETPLARMEEKGKFTLPDQPALLRELRTFVQEARPTDALFRTNHASNYLPLAGRLPRDGAAMAAAIDGALSGRIKLRPEWARGL
jgi:radical SAM superfamily enzyme YgiQ (UPF0313 family)